MKKLFITLPAMAFSLVLFNCQGDIVPPESNIVFTKYPLSEGNSWNYHRIARLDNSDPDSLRGQFPDTLFNEYVTVESRGKSRLMDLFDTYLLVERLTYWEPGGQEYEGRSYYANEPDGLYLYGYLGIGPSLPKTGYPALKFQEKSYRDINELLMQLQLSRLYPAGSSTDSIYLEIPPKKALQYPVRLGATWTFRESGEPSIIVKKINRFETISITAGNFLTFQVKWLYDFNKDGVWDDDISVVDNYANTGLARRVVIIKDIEITDEFLNVIGTFDYLENVELLYYNLNF